jgi:Flp pilus assembly protein TadD
LSLLVPITAALDQPLIIIFPLEGSSNDGVLSWLGEGIATSLTDQLNGAQMRAMDYSERIKLVESLDLPPGAQLSRGSMIRVAQRAGADMVVWGTYSGTEKGLRIAVQALNIKALKLSGEMVANGPLSALPQMENELAWLILTNNRLGKSSSREKFQDRVRKIPNTAYAFYIQSLSASGEPAQMNLLLRALRSYRDFPEAQLRLAKIYFQNGDCTDALPHLEFARVNQDKSMETEFIRGTCLVRENQYDPAIQAFLQLFLVSRPVEALNNIGVAYLLKGDLSSALEALREAKSAARTDPIISLNLAITRHLRGNDSAARIVLEEACKSNPKNGMLHFMLGFLLKVRGENEKAAAAMAKARSLGINVVEIQTENPQMWARLFSDIQSREGRQPGE